jgi:hypothetical protein
VGWDSDLRRLNFETDQSARAEACADGYVRSVATSCDKHPADARNVVSRIEGIPASAEINACRAKTSIIAHSMGNYALEYAMNAVWTRKNRPLLMSLMQEVIMVAADVDNDIFRDGENVSHGDGEGLANLSYRITALYTSSASVPSSLRFQIIRLELSDCEAEHWEFVVRQFQKALLV